MIVLKTNANTLNKNSDPKNTKNSYRCIKFLVNNASFIPNAIKYIESKKNKDVIRKPYVKQYLTFHSAIRGEQIEFKVEERFDGNYYLYNINVYLSTKKRTSSCGT